MSAFDSEVGRLRSQVAAMQQLLEVFEAAALDEATRRDVALATLAHRTRQLRGLAEASLAVNSANTTPAVMEIIADRAARLVGVERAEASLVDADGAEDAGGEALSVPLVARDGTTMGWVRLFIPRDREINDNDDAILTQLAQLGAVALENTREYEREHHIAETLQRSLLPETILSPAGTEIVTRYFPGAGGAKVGGDWYDVIPLPEGMVAVVLGDVVGHGIRAAATMGQLRAALRAYAVVDSSPAAVLRSLERLVAAVGDANEGYVATLVYVVVDPFRGELHHLRAGHPAPMLAHPDGSVGFLVGGLGLPLGLGDPSTVEHCTVAMPVGSTLLLYTDGLIERRGESLDEGLNRLLGACAGGNSTGEDLDSLCDRIIERMSEASPGEDDVALLALRMTGRALEHSWELPVVTSSVPTGRALIVDALHSGGRHQVADVAALVTSELLTNAVKNARRVVRLIVRIEPDGQVHLAVHDDNPSAPDIGALVEPPLEAEGGRGLLIVSSLAERWGITSEDNGKSVWCVLPDADPLVDPLT